MVHIDRIKRLVWGALMAVTCLVVSPVQAASQLYFIHNDHLGTPQAVTDQNQNIVWRKRQQPFGGTTEETGTEDPQLRFPGQYFDEETGYHYNYFRDYDPSTGRYIQSDPIGLDDGTNTYSYVYSNPQKFTDVYGLDGALNRASGINFPMPWEHKRRDCIAKCIAKKIIVGEIQVRSVKGGLEEISNSTSGKTKALAKGIAKKIPVAGQAVTVITLPGTVESCQKECRDCN